MFYVEKSNQENVVELIYSEAGIVIVIDQEESLQSENPVGRIIRRGKKDFKRYFKKASPKLIKMEPIDEYKKKEVIDTFLTDKIGLLRYTEDYVENKKYLDRQEEIQQQTEAQRVRMLKELADDYRPTKPKMKN